MKKLFTSAFFSVVLLSAIMSNAMDEKPFDSSLKKAMGKLVDDSTFITTGVLKQVRSTKKLKPTEELVDDSTFITTGVPEKVPSIKKVKLPKGLVDDSMFICPDDY